MKWIAQTFDEFGRSIGLPGLAPRDGGHISLRIGNDSRLDFRVLDDAVLLLLARPLAGSDRTLAMRRALDLCNLRHGWSLPVKAGLSRDSQLVFIVRVPVREFRPDVVEQAFDLLGRLHEKVSG
jgi:type III secretion system chaperone SycN